MMIAPIGNRGAFSFFGTIRAASPPEENDPRTMTSAGRPPLFLSYEMVSGSESRASSMIPKSGYRFSEKIMLKQ
jgi:hypothetical protein